MDTIIFYKEGASLKEKMESIRLSYTRPYAALFANTEKKMISMVKEYPSSLLIYFGDQLGKRDRIILRNLRGLYADLSVTLCSKATFALDAWKLDLFHFEDYPIESSQIIHSYKKYINKSHESINEFVLKTDMGIKKIGYNAVTYLSADGNYTKIHVKGDRSIIQTKQLQCFQECTEKDLNMKRVHRSYIINFKNVKRVNNTELHFFGCDKPLKVSQSLEKKIKQILLGKAS